MNNINRNIFKHSKVISDTESYILGFIYADGTITHETNGSYKTMRIALQASDSDYLIKMNDHLNGKINFWSKKLYGKIYEEVYLDVNDVDFTKRLINLGVIPRKTYSNDTFVFDNVPNEFKWSFICGYFDGNGCATLNKQNQLYLEICSMNKNFLTAILNYIKIYVPNNVSVTKGDGVKRVRFCGNIKVPLIRDYMYKNIPFCLERKRRILYSNEIAYNEMAS